VLENARLKGVEVLTRLKAAGAGSGTPPSRTLIISADTVVVHDRRVLEKPSVRHCCAQ
jgi:predicted house-cleaning NTP pyrophosphatase (Maf/HAM1 superfamily)